MHVINSAIIQYLRTSNRRGNYMSQAFDKIKETSNDLYEMLKTERDELKLKTHLMKADVRDMWSASEEQWSIFKSKFSVIKKGVGESTSDLESGFSSLGHQIKKAYKDIRKSIKSSQLTK